MREVPSPRSSTDLVRVSLQYQPSMTMARADRRIALERIFTEVARDVLAPRGAAVEEGSISVSGQTIDAVLPRERYDELVDALRCREIRVDRIVQRQVVPPF